MRLIKSSVEIIPQQDNLLNGIYKQIELAGRTCYKSEDKITETSAKEFVDRMIKSGHNAMLEHGTVYLKIPVNIDIAANFIDDISTWTKAKLVKCDSGNWWAITTNYRRIVELNYQQYLEYLCEPTEYHEKRITAKFICDRGISHELVRHRVFSFAQESTRYCNYSKDKFGNQLAFVIPSQFDLEEQNITEKTLNASGTGSLDSICFIKTLLDSEKAYFLLLQESWNPQEARAILPNALKTEVIMTGFESDWKHFFELRCAPQAHPDMQVLANELKEKLQNNGK